MATTVPKPVKQLQEFLQQQQEPFIPEFYLEERGFLRKGLRSKSGCYCYFYGSGEKLPKRTVGSGVKQGIKGIANCPKIIKAAYNWAISISINERLRIKTCKQRDKKSNIGKEFGDIKPGPDFDEFSSASSSTVFNSCSESDVEETTISLQKDHVFRVKTKDSHSIEKEVEN